MNNSDSSSESESDCSTTEADKTVAKQPNQDLNEDEAPVVQALFATRDHETNEPEANSSAESADVVQEAGDKVMTRPARSKKPTQFYGVTQA